MEVSYKKLWKLLIDKDMKKKDLQALAGISWASVTKLSKNETVSMEVLMKECYNRCACKDMQRSAMRYWRYYGINICRSQY